jgi:hypothetical protein
MYDASAGYDYVVFHFGAGPAGSPGGWWQAFYLGGLEGSFSVPTVGGRSVGGFSSAYFCNAVPEIGSTALLLGTGLLVVGIAPNSPPWFALAGFCRFSRTDRGKLGSLRYHN